MAGAAAGQVRRAVEEFPELEAALTSRVWQYSADHAVSAALTRLHTATSDCIPPSAPFTGAEAAGGGGHGYGT